MNGMFVPAAGLVFTMIAVSPLVYTAFLYDAGRDARATEVAHSKA